MFWLMLNVPCIFVFVQEVTRKDFREHLTTWSCGQSMWGLVCIVGSREFQDLSLQGTGGLYLKFFQGIFGVWLTFETSSILRIGIKWNSIISVKWHASGINCHLRVH